MSNHEDYRTAAIAAQRISTETPPTATDCAECGGRMSMRWFDGVGLLRRNPFARCRICHATTFFDSRGLVRVL